MPTFHASPCIYLSKQLLIPHRQLFNDPTFHAHINFLSQISRPRWEEPATRESKERKEKKPAREIKKKKSQWRLVVGFSRYDAQRAGRSVISRDVRRVARLARPLEMPCLWQTGDQPLAPLPHTHGPKVPVPLLPGHVQQDRHSPLPHTHQAQGDSVRQRVLRQGVVREGAAVEDADCPAKEAATPATSAPSSLRRQAFDRAFLRIRATLTVGRAPTKPCLRGGERVKDPFPSTVVLF